MHFYVYLLTMFIGFCTISKAEESFDTAISKGLICTSLDGLKQVINVIGEGGNPSEVAGCGVFKAPTPVPVTAYLIERYAHDKGEFILARFEFLVEIPVLPSKTMYGWIAFKERAAEMSL